MSDNPLAALAMRERAAAMIENNVVETRFDGSRVVVPSPLAKEDQHHRSLAKATRALPTTFTDAELLAAAMQLPEMRELVDAAEATANILANCAVVSGVCCCGDEMERHPEPYSCGHSPVDSGGYAWAHQSKKFESALAPFMKGGE